MDQWNAPANVVRSEVPLRFSGMDALVYVSESSESSMRIDVQARAVLCARMAAGVREGER
ncbi:hypothetical protein [Dermatophilus congolensis]|uniref:hypothetical protein n=1 Tax=Dermatophilus congolensis TaxID=1863 RepID=UPI001AAFB2FD|nr:hypothetical protein [Dermatophilus congolensis]MBO3142554.1 hypothetical protein [Dermatophilus congolensis]MBO3151543.1 hypothetical protein [Dermatophilus congolensis]MBO3161454.1 hypothetical protein [Dermatophilus congolensis]MBO3162828.1 hypothetical protein [Dermatophilus congolensis]MBO3176382.1 hypothetical protein [Dermatophilus congolensis]